MKRLLLLLCIFALVGCSSLPWCKDADKWAERIDKAAAGLAAVRADADAALAAGIITPEQHAEVISVVTAGENALTLARKALSLCIRGQGVSTSIVPNIEAGEAAALSAPRLLALHSGATK